MRLIARSLPFLLSVAIAALASHALCSCVPVAPMPPVVDPVAPPDEIPVPIPPEPEVVVTPAPVDEVSPSSVVPYEKVLLVGSGQLRPSLLEVVGVAPVGDRDQRDGTRILRWAAVNGKGEPKWLDVQVEIDPDAPNDRDRDKVVGKSLVRR